MGDIFDFVKPFKIIIVSCEVWLVFYGFFLLIWDIFFTTFPVTLLGIILVYCCLQYFRIPTPPSPLIAEVFGEDANALVEKFRKREIANMSFIPITSRLAQASTSTPNSSLQTADDKLYTMWTVGHRGAGLDAPENSLSAFRHCKSRGCLAVEFDVAITKDNVAVIFHDDNLTRIAGIDRNIRDMTLEELRLVDISTKHPLGSKFKGEQIPTFDEAITTCLDLDLRFFIDLKDPDLKMVDVVLNAYTKHGDAMHKRAVVSSFYPRLIYQIRKRDPRIIGCLAWRPGYNEYEFWNGDLINLEYRHTLFVTHWFAILQDIVLKWGLHNILWWFLGLSALLINKDGVTKEETSHWMKKGLRVFAWTVNSPIEKLHFTHDYHIGHLTDTLDGGNTWVPRASTSSVALLPPNTEPETTDSRLVASPAQGSSSKAVTNVKSTEFETPAASNIVLNNSNE